MNTKIFNSTCLMKIINFSYTSLENYDNVENIFLKKILNNSAPTYELSTIKITCG